MVTALDVDPAGPRWLPGGDPACDNPRPRPDDGGPIGLMEGEQVPPPVPLPGALLASAQWLRAASAGLFRLGPGVRAAALRRWARSWLDPLDPLRREAMEVLPASWGLPVAEVEQGLDAAFSVILDAPLEAAASGLAPPPPGGPRLPSAHLWPASVPTAGLGPVIGSLLAGRPAIVKTPRGHGTFAALAARSFAIAAPELGPAFAAASWGREDLRATRALLASTGPVFVFGDGDTVAALGHLVSDPARVHAYGPRWSLGYLPQGVELDAAAFAADLRAWHGRGCLCPRWLLVEGAASRAAGIAADLATVLAQAPALDTAEAGARAAWLRTARFLGEVCEHPGGSVAQLPLDLGLPEPPPGIVAVAPVRDQGEALAAVGAVAGSLQGLSVPGDGGADLRGSGWFSWVAPPGSLQRPPALWVHDGVDALRACAEGNG